MAVGGHEAGAADTGGADRELPPAELTGDRSEPRAQTAAAGRTALAVVQPVSLLPSGGEWQTMVGMAEALFRSGLLPPHVRSPQAALAVIQKGRELQVPPMYALTNIVVIQGKPTANAELMLALIFRDHGDDAVRVIETTPERCTIAYRRRSWPEPQTFSFTIEDAQRAGLAGGNNPAWQKYPQAMLRARAISAVARMAFPDSIGGMYTPEEVGARVRVDDAGEIRVVAPRPEPSDTAPAFAHPGAAAPAPPRPVPVPRGVRSDDVVDGELGAGFAIDPSGPRGHPLACMAVLRDGSRCRARLGPVKDRSTGAVTPVEELLRRMRARGVPGDAVLCLKHAAEYVEATGGGERNASSA